MVQLTAFIRLLAATDSDHLLGNDGFGSDVRVSCEKAARGELEGATAARRLRRGAPVERLCSS